jgi:hypothetical protein
VQEAVLVSPVQPQVANAATGPTAMRTTEQIKALPAFPDIPAWRAWEPAEYGPEFILDQLWDQKTRDYLSKVVREVIRVEGPVLADRAAKHLGRMHGLERVRETRVAALKDAIGSAFPVSGDGFYFDIDQDPGTYAKWSKVEGVPRTVGEVSLVELSNSMRDIAKIGLGASRDELISSAAAAFGWARVGGAIRERLEKAVDEGIRRGVLTEANGYLNAV